MIKLKYLLGLALIFYITDQTEAAPQWHNSTDGRRYLIEGDAKFNWFQAHHDCARRSLQLVEIDSQAKNQALVALLKTIFGNTKNLWLGANDEYNRDRNYQRAFYWSTSGKAMTFSYWSNDNPDNHRNNEHCVHTWANAPDFRWNDVPCDGSMGFICEEYYLQEILHKSNDEKQKLFTQTMTKLIQDFEANQKLQMEKLENAQNEIVKEETDLKEHIHNLQTKLEFDITHALAQHQRDLNSALGDRNKKISSLNIEMRSAAEVMSKKFSKELEAIQCSLNTL